MPRRLDAAAPGFEKDFDAFLNSKREMEEDVDVSVAAILKDVRERGDDAVVDYTNRFDRVSFAAEDILLPKARIAEEAAKCDPETVAALQVAAKRIASYHEKMLPESFEYTDDVGVRLGSWWSAVGAAGLYVPGGTAAYPSSVLMNALPAKVDGIGLRHAVELRHDSFACSEAVRRFWGVEG